MSGPDFFGDSFSKRVEDPIVNQIDADSSVEMAFPNKDDKEDDREVLKMY